MKDFVPLNGKGQCPKCRKRGFLTQRQALRRLREIQAKPRGLLIVPVRVYFNRPCGWWHLTSRPGAPKPKKRKGVDKPTQSV